MISALEKLPSACGLRQHFQDLSQFFATRTSQLANNIYHFEQLWYILMQNYGILTLTNEKLKHADFASECRKSRFRGLKIPKFPQGSQTDALPSAAPLIRPHFVKTWIRPRKRVFIRTRDNRPYYSCVLSYLAYE